MLTTTVPAPLRLVTRIAADRAVSTTSLRFVQGMVPEIARKMSEPGRVEAYINREQIAEHTGLSASSTITVYYPKQLTETGIVRMSRKGEYGMIQTGDGEWRGHSSGWVAVPEAYNPTDIPVLKLEAEEYLVDLDRKAIVKGMAPTTSDWAKNPRAHRLILALMHHAGIRRVKLGTKEVVQILGCSRVTAWRVLQRLEKLGFYVDGWIDYAALLIDPTAIMTDQGHEESVRLARVRRWSVFTREGWKMRDQATRWIEIQQTLPKEEVRPAFWEGLTKGMTRAVDYVYKVLSEPYATGRPIPVDWI